MSIASRIESIEEHLIQDWQSIANIGGDTSVDNNIENISQALEGIYEEMPKVSASDVETASLSPTRKGKMKVDLKGNTSQTGTPTPDSPIPINVVSGNNSIDVCGKNLVKLNDSTTTGGITFTKLENGKLRLTGTSTSELYFNIGKARLEANTDYTLSCGQVQSGVVLCYLNHSVSSGSNWVNATTKYTNFQVAETKQYNATLNIKNNVTLNIDMEIQLERGTTMTDFEPYTGIDYPINLGSMELCKIGDYQDRIFKAIEGDSFYDALDSATKQTLTSGSWYKYSAIGKVVLDGSEDWSRYGAYGSAYLFFIEGFKAYTDTTYPCGYGLGNMFEWTQDSTNHATPPYIRFNLTGGNRLYVAITADMTLEQFKTWLSNNNLIVYYILATPIYDKITDTTLISQLEAIKYSYDSQTNISQTPNDLPFILDVSALKEWS